MKKCFLVEFKIHDLPWSVSYVSSSESQAKSDVDEFNGNERIKAGEGEPKIQWRYVESVLL